MGYWGCGWGLVLGLMSVFGVKVGILKTELVLWLGFRYG